LTAHDCFAVVQSQDALRLPQLRPELPWRSDIPANLGFRGYPAARVLHGGGAEPSRTRVRSGAHGFRRVLLHLHLSTPDAPSQIAIGTLFL